MFNFFVSENFRTDDSYYISGADYNHIKNVLRMKEGDTFLVSENGISNLCKIMAFENENVVARIIEENYQSTELPVKIHLFQGLPKSDKLELIIQKTAELGVFSITPTEMNRSIVKIEDKKKKNKIERWQAISESAAKQSKRNIIPEIRNIVSFKEALKEASLYDLILVPFESEKGMESTKNALNEIKAGMDIAVFIGPEGGFDDKEIETAKEQGAKILSLGKRILRTETAAITAVSLLMLHTEMNLSEKNYD